MAIPILPYVVLFSTLGLAPIPCGATGEPPTEFGIVPYKNQISQIPARLNDLRKLDRIFKGHRYIVGNGSLGHVIPWLNVDQVYFSTDMTQAIFVLEGTGASKPEFANQLFRLDQDFQIAVFDSPRTPVATLIFWRVTETDANLLIKEIRFQPVAKGAFSPFGSPAVAEVAEVEPLTPTDERKSEPNAVASCLITGYTSAKAAAGEQLASMIPDFSSWANLKEAVRSLGQSWSAFREFATSLPRTIMETIRNGPESVRALLNLAPASLLNVGCALAGQLASQMAFSTVIQTAKAKLAMFIMSMLGRLEKIANLLKALKDLTRLKIGGLEPSQILERYIVRLLNGRVPGKQEETLGFLAKKNQTGLALQYAECVGR